MVTVMFESHISSMKVINNFISECFSISKNNEFIDNCSDWVISTLFYEIILIIDCVKVFFDQIFVEEVIEEFRIFIYFLIELDSDITINDC